MKKKRILRIITRMNVGGPAVLVETLSNNFENDYEQLLVTGYVAENEIDFSELYKSKLPYKKLVGLGRSINTYSDIKTLFSLISIMRSFQPDIIDTHTSKAGTLGRLASIVGYRKAKRIHTYHGHILHGYFKPWISRLIVFIEKILAKQTHCLIAIGENTRNDLLQVKVGKPKQWTVIHPGVTVRNGIEKAKAKKYFNIPNEICCIGFLGRLAEIKRPDRLIEAVQILKNKTPKPFILLIAGDGNLRSTYESMCEKESLPVRFLGFRSDIEHIISAFDIHVMTSDNEGIPLSIILTGLLHVPTVSTNVGGVSELINNNITGLLTSNTGIDVSNALYDLIRDPEKIISMGKQANEYMSRKFSVDTYIHKHSRLYKQILT